MVKFEIKIEEEQISYPQINQCITQFNIIKNRLPGKVKFEIIAEKQIKEINTLLIACFILFKQQCKDLEIVLHFKKKLANDVAFKLIQFMVHAHYTTGRIDVFTFFDSFGNEHTPRKHKDNLDYGFVLSEKFLPIIYIDKNNYNLLFEKKITHQSLDEMEKGERETGEKGEKLYQYCREFLFKKKDKFSYLEILSQLSFYGALHKAKILQMFLFDEIPDSLKQELKIIDKSKIKVSQLNFKQGEEFYSKIKHIFNALKNKPPIYHLIFYTLLSSDLLPGKLIDGNKKKAPKPPHIGMISDFKKKLTNLWKFTDKLVYGLKELAKNIIDHSSNKHGIFTGKIVTDTNSGKTENLGDQKDVKCQSYFTLNILDDSEKGVIETFLESTKKLEETFGDNKLFLKEDRKQIENGHFKFHNFFHSNESVFLNQQAKRATAHLGLLIFSKLIQTNEGILKASTWGFQQKTPRDMVPKTTS
ncbi:hypothetical protein, partial [Desulfobacula sp.]|uniref:hypothetical protein n=1 Tax=Desulfobacula sp. TaxID=2593537 RepID=UPI0025C38807